MRLTLRHRILILAGLSTVGLALVLAVASWWSQGNARRHIEQVGRAAISRQVEEVLITLVREQAAGIDARLDFARTLALQSSAILRERRRHADVDGQMTLALDDEVLPVLRARDVVFNVSVLSEAYGVWHSSNRVASDDGAWRALFQLVRRTSVDKTPDHSVYWSDVYRNPFRPTRDLSVSAIAIMRDSDGAGWGAVVVTCSLSSLIYRYNQHQAVRGSYTFLLDSERRLVAAPPNGRIELVQTPSSLPSLLVATGQPETPWSVLVEHMALGHRGVEVLQLKGQEKYIAYHPMRAQPWSVGLSVPVELLAAQATTLVDAVDEASRGAVSVMLAIALITAVVALTLAWRMARRLSAPVQRLIALARAIGSGDFAMRADVRTNDELGDLAQAFNTTAAQLENMVERLAAQAEEIQEVNESLHQSSAILEGVFRQMGDALVVVDAAGKPLMANSEAERLFCVTTLVEDPSSWFARYEMSDTQDGHALAIDALPLDQVQRGQHIEAMEVIVRDPEAETWICLSIAARPFYHQDEDDPTIAGVVFVFRDVTLRHQAKMALQRSKAELEQLVDERTRDLRTAQRKLVDLAHQSGRAEVAASVLHNVGNVLNSINVAAMVATEKLQALPVRQFERVAALAERHQGDGDFWVRSRKGQMVPRFLTQLSNALRGKRDALNEQLRELLDHLEHIRRIIELQNRMVTSTPLLEELNLSDIADDAIRINEAGIRNRHIEIVRQYEGLPGLAIERHKVLQILVNLIKNAIHAVAEMDLGSRQIEVSVGWGRDKHWRVAVRDTGVGISQKHLGELFRFGFTTRKDGHGIGLHSCANVAKAMGGSLSASSEGQGCGAMFVLEVPVAGSC